MSNEIRMGERRGVEARCFAFARVVCVVCAARRLCVLAGAAERDRHIAWRIVWTVPAIWLIGWRRDSAGLADAIQRIRRERLLWLAVPTVASLLSVQLWIFLWAPINGRALDVSAGLFLLPISIAVAGWVFLLERPSVLQWGGVPDAYRGEASGVGEADVFLGQCDYCARLSSVIHAALLDKPECGSRLS